MLGIPKKDNNSVKMKDSSKFSLIPYLDSVITCNIKQQ